MTKRLARYTLDYRHYIYLSYHKTPFLTSNELQQTVTLKIAMVYYLLARIGLEKGIFGTSMGFQSKDAMHLGKGFLAAIFSIIVYCSHILFHHTSIGRWWECTNLACEITPKKLWIVHTTYPNLYGRSKYKPKLWQEFKIVINYWKLDT